MDYKIHRGGIMNQGQQQFLNFILARVKEDKVEEAKELLAENFKKQVEGKFTYDDAQQSIPKIIAVLKPEAVDEVLAIMKEFSGNLKHL